MKQSALIKNRYREAEIRKRRPEGNFMAINLSDRAHPKWMTRAYQNNRYIVMIQDNVETTKGLGIRAMIQTIDDAPIKNHWSELQRIKNEIFGGHKIGIEYFPRETDLIDHHNIYWLWIFEESMLPMVLTSPQ